MDDGQRPGPVTPPAPSPRALQLLDDAGRAVADLRRAYARTLDTIDALEADDVAGQLGYPSTGRLLGDHARLDRGEITVLRRHARLTHPTAQPSGHSTPPALPASAALLGDGIIGDGHLRVITTTMTYVWRLPHVDPDTAAVVETQLAELATTRTPAALADAAAEICAQLDPDGAAPTDAEEPIDELHLLRRRDGSLRGKFRFLDPVSAEAVHAAIRAVTPAPTADGDPTATDGPADLDAPDGLGARPLERRQAQALRDLCANALTRGLDVEGDSTDTTDDRVDGADAGDLPDCAEFYAPTGCYELDGSHAAGAPRDSSTRGSSTTGSSTTGSSTTGSSTTGSSMARELAEALSDPQALDSILERTITALLDEHPSSSGRAPIPRPVTSTTKRSLAEGVEGGERVHLAVTIDYDTLRARLGEENTVPGAGGRSAQARLPGLGYLGSGARVGPETARRLACDAEIIPMILGSRSEPLDIGRKTRVVPLPIRRALVARDRHCSFPGCRRRPQACQAHHVEHWIFEGETKIENLCLLCSFHHALVHHSDWSVTMIDGLPWFIPPPWLDREQRPRNNRPWRADPIPACPA